MPAVIHPMLWGALYVEEHSGVLTRVQYLRPGIRESGQGGFLMDGETPLLREACAQLDAYAAGRLRRFSLPLEPQGTEFQRRVWEELCRIPWGQTRSYGAVAQAVGCPHGARAVGMACHRNPLLIVVPCHRVIGADGSLTGFGEGLELKRRLLEAESALLR